MHFQNLLLLFLLRINLNILECKYFLILLNLRIVSSINLNILECKLIKILINIFIIFSINLNILECKLNYWCNWLWSIIWVLI